MDFINEQITEQLKEMSAHLSRLNELIRKSQRTKPAASKINAVINEVLSECMISIKSIGHQYMKDAVSIISEHGPHDLCFSKDVYPRIAARHRDCTAAQVEHSIRNAIDAAYRSILKHSRHCDSLMHSFEKKPSNKQFLLRVTHEVNGRLLALPVTG